MTTAMLQIKVPLYMTQKEINLGTTDAALCAPPHIPKVHQRKPNAERGSKKRK